MIEEELKKAYHYKLLYMLGWARDAGIKNQYRKVEKKYGVKIMTNKQKFRDHERFMVANIELTMVPDNMGNYHVVYPSGTTLFAEPLDERLEMILPVYIRFRLTMDGINVCILTNKRYETTVHSMSDMRKAIEKYFVEQGMRLIEMF